MEGTLDLDLTKVFGQLGIALGLGLLVGLQRERTQSHIAGFRTFPLVAVLGTMTALLARPFGQWVLAAGLLALALMVLVGNMLKAEKEIPGPGITTEVALLLMFVVGAFLAVGPPAIAVAVAGGMAVLLQFKEELHGFAGRLEDADVRAMMQFVLISLVILPVVPDEGYGPYDVLNPRTVWWMVVLIVGIGLGGYIGYKFLGKRAGTLLGGILGGVISSTATTVSYSRIVRRNGMSNTVAARVVVLAASVVFARILVEVLIVSRELFAVALAPLFVMGTVLGLAGLVVWRRKEDADDEPMPAQENPAQLRTALLFAGVFGVVLVAIPWAQEHLGRSGSYAVAAISGLTKMDAITLSTAQLVEAGKLEAGTGWRMILLASLANLLFKAGIVAFLGTRELLRKIALFWGVALVVGVGLLLLWPA